MRYNFLNPTGNCVTATVPPAPDPRPETPDAPQRPSRRSQKAKRNGGRGAVTDETTVLVTLPNGNTFSENHTRKGLEIRFLKKPDESVLAPLRNQRPTWKWSSFSTCWYAKDTPENRMWATQFLDGAASAPVAAGVSPLKPSPDAPETASTASASREDAAVASFASDWKTAVTPDTVGNGGSLQSAPPDGWKESDRVPDIYRRNGVAGAVMTAKRPVVVPQIPPMPGFSPLGMKPAVCHRPSSILHPRPALPARPRPFACK